MTRIDVRKEAAALDEFWSQRVVGEANGCLFKVAKGIGATNWHAHDDQDEVFFVYRGRLTLQLRDGDVMLDEGTCSSSRAALNTARRPRPRSI